MGWLDSTIGKLPGFSSGTLGKMTGVNDNPPEQNYWFFKDAQQNTLNNMKSNPYSGYSNQDWINRMAGKYAGETDWFGKQGYEGRAANVGVNNQLALRQASTPASLQAYANLMNLLTNQGRTDPRMMNAQMGSIQRDTQGQQMAMQGMSARQGMQNSGVNAALQAAIGNAGVGRQADLRAKDAYDSEQRRRSDLELFQQLIGQPSTDQTALAMGQYNSDKANDTQKKAATMSAIGQLIGGFFGMGG